LEEERHRESIKQGIQQFEKSELHHVNTEEKVFIFILNDIKNM
jgi:hypothetical protein